MSDSISPAKVEANRQNARKATGPKDTTSTRYNAAKHGLLAQGITELDDADAYTALLQRLNGSYKPAGDIETFLVERIALAMVRLRRIARMEAEYITDVLHSPVPDGNEPQVIVVRVRRVGRETDYEEPQNTLPNDDPGLTRPMTAEEVEALAGTFQRYESAMENKLYRAMNQLERLQRMRLGEQIAAPASVDVTLHTGA
jgi:hypothetical protein